MREDETHNRTIGVRREWTCHAKLAQVPMNVLDVNWHLYEWIRTSRHASIPTSRIDHSKAGKVGTNRSSVHRNLGTLEASQRNSRFPHTTRYYQRGYSVLDRALGSHQTLYPCVETRTTLQDAGPELEEGMSPGTAGPVHSHREVLGTHISY